MRTILALTAILAACSSSPTPPTVPPIYPSPHPPLVEYTDVDACATVAEVACFDNCGSGCFDRVYLGCCGGQPCENYGSDAVVYAPSESDARTQWQRCLDSRPACGEITSACELMAPAFPQ